MSSVFLWNLRPADTTHINFDTFLIRKFYTFINCQRPCLWNNSKFQKSSRFMLTRCIIKLKSKNSPCNRASSSLEVSLTYQYVLCVWFSSCMGCPYHPWSLIGQSGTSLNSDWSRPSFVSKCLLADTHYLVGTSWTRAAPEHRQLFLVFSL